MRRSSVPASEHTPAAECLRRSIRLRQSIHLRQRASGRAYICVSVPAAEHTPAAEEHINRNFCKLYVDKEKFLD